MAKIMKIFLTILFCACSILLLSCYARLTPVNNNKFLESEHKIEKNYSINISINSFVGESMIKVKDFYVDKYESSYLTPNKNFTAKIGLTSCEGFQGAKYQISGQTKMENEVYNVIFLPQKITTFSAPGYMGLLINKDGFLHTKILNENSAIQVGSIKYEPQDLKFYHVYEEYFNESSGYVNYELVYSGIDGSSIKILYREYTPNDLAKPAFFQNMTYDISSEYIRFQKIKMKINKINNEEINFTVIEDGMIQ